MGASELFKCYQVEIEDVDLGGVVAVSEYVPPEREGWQIVNDDMLHIAHWRSGWTDKALQPQICRALTKIHHQEVMRACRARFARDMDDAQIEAHLRREEAA